MAMSPSTGAAASANRLATALSPYLRQHAGNPVAWQPWDEQALREARERDVPIMLSIGYAACHWCHVMEHESFAVERTAELLNRSFDLIKVDRLERPDLDKVYQSAHYLLTRGSGGWPLTVFLAPDLTPFFAGTYFPPSPRGGLQAFSSVIERVAAVWGEQREAIARQNESLLRSLAKLDRAEGTGTAPVPAREAVAAGVRQLAGAIDEEHGGLGKAPKFPQVPALMLLLEQHAAHPDARLAERLRLTLDAMAAGGLHDHAGAGFFRYCVDPLWDVPHFEKMLTDNAQLLELYALASAVLDEPGYAQVAQRTASWLLGPMRDAAGGFLTSLDADAGGEEGASYAWSEAEIAQALDSRQLEFVRQRFSLGGIPNFGSVYHLRMPAGQRWRAPDGELDEALQILRARRELRPQPAVDDKVLALSCGLGAVALARAARVLDVPEWAEAARCALEFARGTLAPDGRMRVAWREGRCSDASACLDDYAAIAAGWLELLQFSCDEQTAAGARNAAEAMLAEFDDGGGGLRFVPRSEQPVLRVLRGGDDGATPAGNGTAALVLLQLGWLLGDGRMLEAAERILAAFADLMSESSQFCPTLLRALARWHDRPPQAAVFGPSDEAARWCRQLRAANPLLAAYPVGISVGLPGMLSQDRPQPAVCAKICRAGTCGLPLGALADALGQASQPSTL